VGISGDKRGKWKKWKKWKKRERKRKKRRYGLKNPSYIYRDFRRSFFLFEFLRFPGMKTREEIQEIATSMGQDLFIRATEKHLVEGWDASRALFFPFFVWIGLELRIYLHPHHETLGIDDDDK